MLRGLDRVRAHAVEIDALRLRMAHDDRLQARDSHLDRFLHHVVEPRMFQWREQVVQVAQLGLLPRALDDDELRAFLSRGAELCTPLAIALVEDQNRRTGL